MHYMRKRSGMIDWDTRPLRERLGDLCRIEGCTHKPQARNLCEAHYARHRRGTPLAPLVGEVTPNPRAICASPSCEKPTKARGFCSGHYDRFMKGTETESALNTRPRYRVRDRDEWGPLIYDKQGYTYRKRGVNPEREDKRRKIAEHRRVMEIELGRRLYDHETVHHINGVRDDNRPENLELWSSRHPGGQRVQDKVAWAKELLALYEPSALA